jgi:hypothetical protein
VKPENIRVGDVLFYRRGPTCNIAEIIKVYRVHGTYRVWLRPNRHGPINLGWDSTGFANGILQIYREDERIFAKGREE